MKERELHNYEEDRYELLCETDEEAKTINEELNNLLETLVLEIEFMKRKYPKAGIGDTATDEAIANEFYRLLLWS